LAENFAEDSFYVGDIALRLRAIEKKI